MSTSRLVSSLLFRASRSSLPIATRQCKAFPSASSRPPQGVIAAKSSPCRFYSQQPKPSKIYFFQDIVSHVEKPDKNRILIDTREPSELQNTGTIPGSLKIPITSKPDSFFITAEEFEDRFGFERPGKDKEVVFYCKAGVRSRAAAELARQGGWQKVGEYSGSWMDWEASGGKKEDWKA